MNRIKKKTRTTRPKRTKKEEENVEEDDKIFCLFICSRGDVLPNCVAARTAVGVDSSVCVGAGD